MKLPFSVRRLLGTGTVVLFGSSAEAQSSAADLDVAARDGARLRATYFSPGRPGPGVLLLHQCNMDRRSWVSLGTALAESGVHAFALDYRGYGDSPRAGSRGELQSDIDSAFATLLGRAGVDSSRIAVAGASCGVDNAIQLARRAGRINALVLLSGPTTPAGLAYLRDHPTTAIFAAASSSEDFAVSSLRTVTATSTNAATVMRVINKPGHGTPLFAAEPELLAAVVRWVNQVLR
jgi:pimeloyl-ACP methyl ester carboxylesterase